MADSGKLIKDTDYSGTVDKMLPEYQEMAKVFTNPDKTNM